MAIENARWLASVIAAHPNHEVVGRTRLQKTVCLLQRLGMPTDYAFSLHFYGPYSEDLRADIGVCGQLGLVEERVQTGMDGTDYYVLTAPAAALKPEFDVFRHYVDLFSQQTLVTLELAATYDAFRQMGLSHDESLSRLRAKKGEKCAGGREAMAIELLGRVHLPEAV
jgi:uncharacterized protein YwgA